MGPRVKWNKIIFAAKTISFHFTRGSMLKWNYFKEFENLAATIGYLLNIFASFQTWFHDKIKQQNSLKSFMIILFHFMMEPRLK